MSIPDAAAPEQGIAVWLQMAPAGSIVTAAVIAPANP